ncbi:hypothetical protein ACVWWR_003568 [Bradyrhizobium sp. LM3.2]
MARKTIAEIAVRAVELPTLEQLVRHRIVMDRQEEIGPTVIRGTDPLEQARPCLAVRDEQAGCGEAFRLEFRRDEPRKPEVEAELRIIARAQRAVGVWRVPDIHDDPEFRHLAFGR